ncbi:MAG: peptidase M24, partial [Rhodobacteraceae bacterium]
MNKNFSVKRKIFPTDSGDISANYHKKNKVEIGPSKLALDEWHKAGLNLPNLSKMRQYRLNRI